jgi:shikimate kinase
MPSKPIVLIGPMGVGKTTIGKKLAKRLELPFIDTDQVLIGKYGPISQIFEEHGEDHFRKLEEIEVAESLGARGVISTGGGAVLSPETQKRLRKAIVIYLETDGRHIGSRLSKGNRPLLKNGFEDWKKIYAERRPIYEKLADITINTSKQGLRATLDEICERLDRDE